MNLLRLLSILIAPLAREPMGDMFLIGYEVRGEHAGLYRRSYSFSLGESNDTRF